VTPKAPGVGSSERKPASCCRRPQENATGNATNGFAQKANLTTDEHGCHGFANLKVVPIETFLIRVIRGIRGKGWVLVQTQ
jgi:hypothetical protein